MHAHTRTPPRARALTHSPIHVYTHPQVTLGNGAVTDPCTWEDPNWVAGFIRTDDGQEEMHFLLNQNKFDHHSFSMADIWFTWYVF